MRLVARQIFLLLLLVILGSRAPAEMAYQAASIENAIDLPTSVNRDYRFLAPEAAGHKMPLVIYLHGAGSKGADNTKPITEPLPKFLATPAMRAKFPCYVLVPQCREGNDASGLPNNWVKWIGQKDHPPAKWETSEAGPSDQLRAAMAALDEMLAKHPIDPKRIYLTGVSMGASGSWNWAAHQPDKFAAIMVACGLSETANAAKLADLPIWAFHGSEDEIVPVERSRQMIKALRTAGGVNVKFTEYAGLGHNIAPNFLSEPGAFEWLFSFSKNLPRVVATPKERAPIAGHATGKLPKAVANVSPADTEFFEKRIRPVLSERCFECHAEKKQKGGLRLDSRAAIMAGGDIGPAIVEGKPEESLLLKVVRYEDEDLEMPPKKQLPEKEIADLAEWVKRGAPWPGEAATAPLAKSGEEGFSAEMKAHWAFQPLAKPAVPAAPADTNPIDAFLNQKLAAAGIKPAPPADAATFLRRVTYDLTGLPPEGGTNKSPEELITALLASPHHGEHYARHWLDVARYSDSNGSEVDHAMTNAWRYRDYVVNAFNSDKPYDQFLREQLAGDLLGNGNLAATGFLMLGPKALAELDKPKLVADIVDEQVDTVSRAFMGLTVGCARCHDHKFDPISAADYYSLAGIFNSTRSMDISKRVATWTERALNAADQSKVDSLLNRVADLKVQRDAGGATPKTKLMLESGKKFLLVEAENFTRGNVRVETDSLGKGIGVVRTLMEYPDHLEYEIELPAAGMYQLELRYAAKESRPTELSINENLVEMSAATEVTGDWKPAAQRWFLQGVYAFKKGRNLIAFHRDGPVPLFDKILVGEVSGQPYGPTIPVEPVKLSAETKNKKDLDAAITATQRELETIPTTLAPFDGPVADAPILVRGNPASPGEVVPRGFPSIVTGVAGAKPGAGQSGRRELAEWLTQANHPLTARVMVNRVWQWHFGKGLVGSPDNFGLRGETPSHPELLDWLATWFVENGWSMKKLHTLICTSEAYRRSSVAPVNNGDPENRLLGHFPRRRLRAEELRDSMLAISGKLDRTLGGSLMTVLNRNYAAGGNAAPDVAKEMHYDAPRRSLYLPIVRSALNDFLAAFDYPDPAMLTGQRSSTTVAPQALFLMNSPFVKQQAEDFAKQLARAGDDDARLKAAYQSAFGRLPSDSEAAAAMKFLEGDGPKDLAWTRLCHVLLASNEFLYVR